MCGMAGHVRNAPPPLLSNAASLCFTITYCAAAGWVAACGYTERAKTDAAAMQER